MPAFCMPTTKGDLPAPGLFCLIAVSKTLSLYATRTPIDNTPPISAQTSVSLVQTMVARAHRRSGSAKTLFVQPLVCFVEDSLPRQQRPTCLSSFIITLSIITAMDSPPPTRWSAALGQTAKLFIPYANAAYTNVARKPKNLPKAPSLRCGRMAPGFRLDRSML